MEIPFTCSHTYQSFIVLVHPRYVLSFTFVKPMEKVGTQAGALEVVDELELVEDVDVRIAVGKAVIVEETVLVVEVKLEEENPIVDDVCVGVIEDVDNEPDTIGPTDEVVDDVLKLIEEDSAALSRRPVQT